MKVWRTRSTTYVPWELQQISHLKNKKQLFFEGGANEKNIQIIMRVTLYLYDKIFGISISLTKLYSWKSYIHLQIIYHIVLGRTLHGQLHSPYLSHIKITIRIQIPYDTIDSSYIKDNLLSFQSPWERIPWLSYNLVCLDQQNDHNNIL
jgi:hypothetical protein